MKPCGPDARPCRNRAPVGPASAVKTALIVVAVAVGLVLSVDSFAAKQAKQAAPAVHADASQIGRAHV